MRRSRGKILLAMAVVAGLAGPAGSSTAMAGISLDASECKQGRVSGGHIDEIGSLFKEQFYETNTLLWGGESVTCPSAIGDDDNNHSAPWKNKHVQLGVLFQGPGDSLETYESLNGQPVLQVLEFMEGHLSEGFPGHGGKRPTETFPYCASDGVTGGGGNGNRDGPNFAAALPGPTGPVVPEPAGIALMFGLLMLGLLPRRPDKRRPD